MKRKYLVMLEGKNHKKILTTRIFKNPILAASDYIMSLGRFKYRFIKLCILIGSNFVYYVLKSMTKGREMLAGPNGYESGKAAS